jgi:hypothetical protein
VFYPKVDCFNPLKKIDYKRRRGRLPQQFSGAEPNLKGVLRRGPASSHTATLLPFPSVPGSQSERNQARQHRICGALRSKLAKTVPSRCRWRGSCQELARLRLSLRFSYRAAALPRQPTLQARMIVLLHRILPRCTEATGTIILTGRHIANVGTWVRPASPRNNWRRSLNPRRPRPHNRLRCLRPTARQGTTVWRQARIKQALGRQFPRHSLH